MFKRGFASYTKTGRRIQYGAAIGSAMTRGSNRSNRSNDSSEQQMSGSACILFIIVVYILFRRIIQSANQKHIQ